MVHPLFAIGGKSKNKVLVKTRLSRNGVEIVLKESVHTLQQLGYIRKPPSLGIDGSKTRRSPHKGIDSHRENKLLFGTLLTLQCCSR